MSIDKNNTLIILDWDNTLFPTTWALENNINFSDAEVTNKYISYFSDLDKMLYKLIKKLQDHGKVVIITNALPEWIKSSASVLHYNYNLLFKIKVVSARKRYKNVSSGINDWKVKAFHDELLFEMKDKKISHIISIGDALYEYRALINLYDLEHGGKKILKSIKLVDNPNYETLIDQLEVLSRSIKNFCVPNKHMDLKFKFFSPYRYN